MGKVKVQMKADKGGKLIGKQTSRLEASEGEGKKLLYRPKAKFTAHIKNGRQ